MSKPLVSVVMPTYNHAQYIKESIDSVLSQSYSNIELIIVDNYSTDNTKHIVQSYDDPRIIYKQFSNNGIIAASRNRGIKAAQGDYIAFIDSDDMWLSNKIQKQVELFLADTSLGLVYTQFRVLSADEDNGRVVGPKHERLQGDVYLQLLKNNFVTSSSVMAKTEFVRECDGFDEEPELRCSEDFDLWLKIARKYSIGFIAEPLGIYRKHGANASASSDRLQKALSVIDRHYQRKWVSEQDAIKAKCSFMVRVAWRTLDQTPQKARSHLKYCLKSHFASSKIKMFSVTAYILSFMPFFYHAIVNSGLDRKLMAMMEGAQDL